MEEEKTGKIEVLHSAIVAPGWAAKHCLGCSAGTRGLRQAMESVVVVYTMLTGAGLLCSSSVAGTDYTVHWSLYRRPQHSLPRQHWDQGGPCSAPSPLSIALGPGSSSCPPTNQARGGRNRRVRQGQSDLPMFHLSSKIGPPITCL